MGSYVSKDVLCPYYHEAESQKVKCEGVDTEDMSSIHLSFGNRTDCRNYMTEYCCGKYQMCRLAQMNDRKWEDT